MSAVAAALAAASVIMYVNGWVQLRTVRRRAPVRRMLAFTSGVLIAIVATASPLAASAERTLSGHMAQHLTLLYVVPILVLAGRPAHTVLGGISAPARRALGRVASSGARRIERLSRSPIVISVTVTLTMWGWHLPGPYDAALRHRAVHLLEHATFMIGGFVLCGYILRARRRRAFVTGIGVLLVTSLSGGALGAALVLASEPLYASYRGAGGLADQQLAGALMWVPPGVIHTVAAGSLAVAWLRRLDARFAPRAGPSAEAAVRGTS